MDVAMLIEVLHKMVKHNASIWGHVLMLLYCCWLVLVVVAVVILLVSEKIQEGIQQLFKHLHMGNQGRFWNTENVWHPTVYDEEIIEDVICDGVLGGREEEGSCPQEDAFMEEDSKE